MCCSTALWPLEAASAKEEPPHTTNRGVRTGEARVPRRGQGGAAQMKNLVILQMGSPPLPPLPDTGFARAEPPVGGWWGVLPPTRPKFPQCPHLRARSITEHTARCPLTNPLKVRHPCPPPRRLAAPPRRVLPSTLNLSVAPPTHRRCPRARPFCAPCTHRQRARRVTAGRRGDRRAAGRGERAVDGGRRASTCAPNSPPPLPTPLLRAAHAPPVRTPQCCRPARGEGGCGARREGGWWRAAPALPALRRSCPKLI